MSTVSEDLERYCLNVAQRAKQASRDLGSLSTAAKNVWLRKAADRIESEADRIISANALDVAAAPDFGLTDAAIDRLRLDAKRLAAISQSVREIADLPDPIGEVMDGFRRPNGIEIQKVRVPLGVVFFIYESRPNVTVDAAAICIKSGNAVILRGGKEAIHSSSALVAIMNEAAKECGIPNDAVSFVETTDRQAVGYFLGMSDLIDVAIPRGGKGLIERVVSEARMPVIKHFDGNCHVYVDASADGAMAIDIIVNSKCQRMGVCNACESLLIHGDVAPQLLPKISAALTAHGVEIRGDDRTCDLVHNAVPATEEDWGMEYLGPIISCKVVDSLGEAIEHINRYGSKHTDAIVTNDLKASREFTLKVDSSAVMVNASTRFNDGGMFGMGAEIGISTDKFHARGPCGLRELTTYKYIVHGNGQVRE